MVSTRTPPSPSSPSGLPEAKGNDAAHLLSADEISDVRKLVQCAGGTLILMQQNPAGYYHWTKRVAWWQRAWDTSPGIPGHHAEYGRALTQWMADAGVSAGDVGEWRRMFDHLVTWQET